MRICTDINTENEVVKPLIIHEDASGKKSIPNIVRQVTSVIKSVDDSEMDSLFNEIRTLLKPYKEGKVQKDSTLFLGSVYSDKGEVSVVLRRVFSDTGNNVSIALSLCLENSLLTNHAYQVIMDSKGTAYLPITNVVFELGVGMYSKQSVSYSPYEQYELIGNTKYSYVAPPILGNSYQWIVNKSINTICDALGVELPTFKSLLERCESTLIVDTVELPTFVDRLLLSEVTVNG